MPAKPADFTSSSISVATASLITCCCSSMLSISVGTISASKLVTPTNAYARVGTMAMSAWPDWTACNAPTSIDLVAPSNPGSAVSWSAPPETLASSSRNGCASPSPPPRVLAIFRLVGAAVTGPPALSTLPALPLHPVTSSSATNDAPASSLRGGRLCRRSSPEALEPMDSRHGRVEWRTFVPVVCAIGHSFQRNDREDEAAWEVGCLSWSTVAFRALRGIGANPHLSDCAGGSALIAGSGAYAPFHKR